MPGKLVEGDHVLPPHFFCGKVSALQDFLESNFSRAESEVYCPQTSLRLTNRSHAHSASSLLRAFHSSPRTRRCGGSRSIPEFHRLKDHKGSETSAGMSKQIELGLFEQNPVEHTAGIVRTFLGWDRPLLTLAIEHLTRDWTDHTLDLSHQLIVVPTRQAGRRLRSSLALRASEKNAGVLPPAVVTPDHLLSAACLPGLSKGVASRAEVIVAWADTLLEANLDDFRNVFPVEPVERSLGWALRTAEDLMSVHNLLGEAGYTMQSAAKELAREGLEPQRWAELARLERLAQHLLTGRKRLSPQVARIEAAHDGVVGEHIDTILVLGVPDPPPLLCTALKHHVAQVRCEIVIHAPDHLASSFDEFGRPVPLEWVERTIEIPDLENTVHHAVNPNAQAAFVTRLLSSTENLAAVAAIGAPDPELLLPLEEAFAAAGQTTFNPAGESVSNQALTTLLRTLYRLALSQSFLGFLELLRVPGVAERVSTWQATTERPEFDAPAMLVELDAFQRDHIPESLESADRINQTCQRPNPAVTRALSWMQTWLRRLAREKIWEVLPEFLSEIYASSEFDPSNPFDEAFTATTGLLHGILDTFEAGLLRDLKLATEFPDRLRLILHLLEQETIYNDRKPGAVDLQGWMELPWEDAPHLVVTGMNDGFVPEAIKGHAYLPDSARRFLGLRHNESRHARDAYILSSLLACRRDHGKIDLVFGRRSAREEPLRPSRLLFACPPEDLAARVSLLFGATLPARESPAWSLTWQLTPPAPDDSMRIFERLPVTAFRDYLSCPFRFYLRRGLRMERDDGPLLELDARHFGTLCHLVVEDFAASAVRDSDREKEISEFFENTLASIVSHEYGDRLPVPILVQRESARQRLNWWATIEAEQRRLGWQIVEYERSLDSEENPWLVHGVRITGKIDRIERSSATETLRILDFKTGRLKSPRDAHLRNLRRHEDPTGLPSWMMIPAGNSVQRWVDLQLPLYLLALDAAGQSGPMVAGYANLGRAKSEVALKVWDDLDGHLLAAARTCLEGVIESVTARRFWPPAERVDYDDFGQILLGDPQQSVNPSNLLVAP